MAEPFAVEVPLVNPNEPEAIVVDVIVSDGKEVSEGEVLCVLETSKSVEDMYAPASGYVVGLDAKLGTTVTAGNVLCYIAPDPDWTRQRPKHRLLTSTSRNRRWRWPKSWVSI
jgi:pyruvate/2-oxoglutarate dehydrogenase complex dihydrolipoamide acyltransferase (E2) component